MKLLVKVRVVLFSLVLLLSVVCQVAAQSNGSKPSPPRVPDITASQQSPDDRDRSPLTSFEEEIRAKRAIKLAEKEHQENLDRAKEIADLGRQLGQTLKTKNNIDRDDAKKIDKLEKLTKKVRGEAGGEDEEVKIVDKPKDIGTAACQISDAAEKLSKNVQDTPRQVVSASVIGNANVLLELIRILRTFSREGSH